MKKIIAFITSFAMAFSLCVVPASAETTSSTFSEWVSNVISNLSPGYNWWKNIYNGGNSTAYDDYVATLPVTNINSSGLSTFYIDGWEYSGSSFTISSSSVESPSISGYCSSTSATYVLMHSGFFTVPATGTYDLYVSACTASYPYSASAIFYLYSYSDGVYSPVTPVGGTGSDGTYSSSHTSILSAANTRYFRCSLTAGVQYIVSTGSGSPLSNSGFAFKPSSVSDLCSFSCSMWISGLNYSTSTDYDYSSDTRAGAITGDFVSVDGDVYNDCTIFNETTNTYTDPSIGTTTAISTWTYDYATRTYSLYDADGNLISVAYQDQQLVITSGGNTKDYYYATDSSGGSSGGSTGTASGVFGALINLLSSINGVISSAVSSVGSVLSSLITTVGNIFTGIFGLFNNLNTFIFGDGSTQSATDFYNSPSTFSGGSVWG